MFKFKTKTSQTILSPLVEALQHLSTASSLTCTPQLTNYTKQVNQSVITLCEIASTFYPNTKDLLSHANELQHSIHVNHLQAILNHTHLILEKAEEIKVQQIVSSLKQLVPRDKPSLLSTLVSLKQIKPQVLNHAQELLDQRCRNQLNQDWNLLETLTISLTKSLPNLDCHGFDLMIDLLCRHLLSLDEPKKLSHPLLITFLKNPNFEMIGTIKELPEIQWLTSFKLVSNATGRETWFETIWKSFLQDLESNVIVNRVQIGEMMPVSGQVGIIETIEEEEDVPSLQQPLETPVEPLQSVIKPLEDALIIHHSDKLQHLLDLFKHLSTIHYNLNHGQDVKHILISTCRQITSHLSQFKGRNMPINSKLQPLYIEHDVLTNAIQTASIQLKLISSVKTWMKDTDVDGELLSCVSRICKCAIEWSNLDKTLEQHS